MTNAGAALVQVAEKLPEASALQAATIAGIMIDKNAILRGKVVNTPLVEIHLTAVKEVARLEAELRALEAPPATPGDCALRQPAAPLYVEATEAATVGTDEPQPLRELPKE